MNYRDRSSTVGRATWTKILGKNATSQYTKKNVHDLVFRANRTYNYNISDIQNLSKMILWMLMNPGMEKDGVRMLKSYNFDYTDIASLTKCSKEYEGNSKTSILDNMWKLADKKLIKNLCKEIEVYKSDLIETSIPSKPRKIKPIFDGSKTKIQISRSDATKKKFVLKPRKKIKIVKKKT
jgi:hypothetical protein